jgi:hypothetical protein
MRSLILRGLVAVLMLLGFASGFTAWAMLSAIHSGAYEPIRDDGATVAEAANLPTRLKLIGGATLGVGGVCAVWLCWSALKSSSGCT